MSLQISCIFLVKCSNRFKLTRSKPLVLMLEHKMNITHPLVEDSSLNKNSSPTESSGIE
jgi:hypothetical protein